jgi:flavin reductase (DIM6/NTAB) family NADH-FMN oxidoreductase RutF
MNNSFSDLRIVDNFYQTSGFFPMPTTLISSLCEDGLTTLGAYSLIFPYYIAGKEYYAMVLQCRNNSNTASNLFKNGKCAINFIPDTRKYFKEAVRLGYPGDTPQEKMATCSFTMQDGLCVSEDPQTLRPKVIAEAFQVYECTWMKELDGAQHDLWHEGYSGPYRDFNGITSETGAHFILRIDKILIKEKYKRSIINGTKKNGFPRVPVDYGYRDNTRFWYTAFRRPRSTPIPKGKGLDISVVMYSADRIDDKIKFTQEACETIVKVPRIFLNRVLLACVNWAKDNNVTLITAEHMKIINNKRSKD